MNLNETCGLAVESTKKTQKNRIQIERVKKIKCFKKSQSKHVSLRSAGRTKETQIRSFDNYF